MRGFLLHAALLIVLRADAWAQADSLPRIEMGAFVDVYYAYDFGRPRTIDRQFTTQAARHAEFNVNLAHIEARLTGARARGRIATQFGTAVQANSAAEPRVGGLSGPELSRFIQEAYAGYRLTSDLWIDAGVFFAPFGAESWISSDNWTYTRSLIAENSPYYQSGVRATWSRSALLSLQAHVINGWQNISETNSDKALALRVDFAPSPKLLVAYDAFVGNEQPDSVRGALRVFHEVLSRVRVTDHFEIAATLDRGSQARGAAGASNTWTGWAVLGRYAFTRIAAIAGRVEKYSDPDQVILLTGQPYGLRAHGASMNLDIAAHPGALWRIEARHLKAADPLFANASAASELARTNWVVATSLSWRM